MELTKDDVKEFVLELGARLSNAESDIIWTNEFRERFERVISYLS